MAKTIELKVHPEVAERGDLLENEVKKRVGECQYKIRKKSIDARKKPVMINLQIEIFTKKETIPELETPVYQDVSKKEQVIIVGSGPAGLFAGLRCLELGMKPIIIERGKDVQARRRDLANINQKHIVNPDSNYCFGEGGAGTYSDGKLYTRSKKRGSVNKIL